MSVMRGNLKVKVANRVHYHGPTHDHRMGVAQLTLLLVPDVGRVVHVVAVVKLGAVGRRSLLGRLVIVYRHGCDFSCLALRIQVAASAPGPIWDALASSLPSVGGGRRRPEARR